MKHLVLAGSMVMLPIAAVAGSTAVVGQYGNENTQATFQSGENLAITMQFGDSNSALTVVSGGPPKASAIVQVGDGFTRQNIVTDESVKAMGSFQMDIEDTPFDTQVTAVGGNDVGRIVVAVELANPPLDED